MPSDNICQYNDKRISVEDAKLIREGAPQAAFFCIHCGGRVKPHIGDDNKPHFEHFPRENLHCPIRHIPSGKSSAAGKSFTRDFDDQATIEGTKSDVTRMVSERDRAAAAACKKRDNYICQACGFHLKVGKRYVIDCHHLHPVALGVRNTILDDLVSLCPTCHRIAHTRDVPLELADIRRIMAQVKPTKRL